jgi:hypothetical protein
MSQPRRGGGWWRRSPEAAFDGALRRAETGGREFTRTAVAYRGWTDGVVLFVQLILHIGTHKTGTSALQECLRRNEQIFADRGIHYARIAPSKNSNALGRLIVKDGRAEVRAFVDRQVDKASTLGANRLVISAESLYAMTIFFHKFNGRQYNYWKSESEAIEFLHSVLPPDMPTRLIVFFRRQDYFLESIYREVIKSRAVAMPIDEFRLFMSEALDYWRHMETWSAVFPECAVYTYEQVSNNIFEFFLRNVLQLANTEEFEGVDLRVNVRLSRDVLEYKRMLNGMDMSAVDRRMSKLACTELARTLTDDGRYQDYLAPEARAALLREMERGNALLSETFGMKPFPTISDDSLKAWAPYPGLSAERARELAKRHARIRKGAGYRIERSALLAREFIQRRLPMLASIIPLGRLLLPRYRHSR